MADVTAEEVKQIKEDLANIELVADESGNDVFNSMIQLLDTPDDEFVLLAPGIMQAFEQSLNNPNDKIALTQSLNALGYRGEDLTENFLQIVEEIDKMDYSVPKKDFLKGVFGALSNAVNDTEGIAKRTVQIPIELCHNDAKIPQYAHISDSGLDVYALDDITIKPGETVLVPTGIKVALPPGYEIQVRPKSGRCVKTKLRVANTPGTIDQGYRDEIKVIIENIEAPIKDIDYEFVVPTNQHGEQTGPPYCRINSILHGSDFTIGKGEKFAQLVLMEVPKAAFYRVDTVRDIGEDRGGGFGSTGLK